jgi:hypothetical protein
LVKYYDFGGILYMGTYDAALICENGHVVNTRFYESPARNEKFCSDCGSPTIHQCPECNSDIRGYYKTPGVISISPMPVAPSYCHECGKPYPWTIKEIEAAKELINLTDLTESDKSEFINSLEDISVEGPKNKVGVAKVKIFLGKIKNGLREDVKEVITNIAAEVIKEQLKGM